MLYGPVSVWVLCVRCMAEQLKLGFVAVRNRTQKELDAGVGMQAAKVFNTRAARAAAT